MSILQALYLMNNEFIARQTSVLKNPTLATLAEQNTSNARKVESLYLVVLSRSPDPRKTLGSLLTLPRATRSQPWPTCFGYCSTARSLFSTIRNGNELSLERLGERRGVSPTSLPIGVRIFFRDDSSGLRLDARLSYGGNSPCLDPIILRRSLASRAAIG